MSLGSYVRRDSDLERINVLVHSMSIIVNQSVHNSRSNLRENGYLGSSTFVEDCVNPSRGIVKLLRRAVGYIVMSVYKQMLPDITRGSIDHETASLVALTRSVLNVYMGIAMSKPSTRILRMIAQQGMLRDIALLWHLASDILSDTACFKSVREQGYLSSRVASSLGTLYVMVCDSLPYDHNTKSHETQVRYSRRCRRDAFCVFRGSHEDKHTSGAALQSAWVCLPS